MMMANNERNSYFAVIDTETNWDNEVMSIGIVIAESLSFEEISSKYYIISPECDRGGMYSFALKRKGVKVSLKKTRDNVVSDLTNELKKFNVDLVFAYNAAFDYNHMPELHDYKWFDIMKLAAYRQYNKALSEYDEYCATGRLKRNYGVESIMRLLWDYRYCEKHNAICDAVDELKIMKLLGYGIDAYDHAQINIHKEKKKSYAHKKSNESNAKGSSKAQTTFTYSVGDKIIHSEFGKGVISGLRIITNDLYYIDVQFKMYGDMVFQMPHNEKYFSKANE